MGWKGARCGVHRHRYQFHPIACRQDKRQWVIHRPQGGEGGGAARGVGVQGQRAHPQAMERAVVVCRKFVELSKNFRTDHILAVATSAAREATNQQDLLDRIKVGAGLEVSVISGREEARLIYLGVSSGLHIGKKKALFIDIGGGSCEVVIGDQQQYLYLDSLKLGAIRMTTLSSPMGTPGRSPMPFTTRCASMSGRPSFGPGRRWPSTRSPTWWPPRGRPSTLPR